MITQDYLKEMLDYDLSTGVFTWIKASRCGYVGRVAGYKNVEGYIQIMICKKPYYAHRLAWLYSHGNFPENKIDHINQIRDDNSLINLRDCTQSENLGNQKKQTNNISGYKGVYWEKNNNKWKAQIGHNRKRIHLGRYDRKEDAAAAYDKKALELFGKFAALNMPLPEPPEKE